MRSLLLLAAAIVMAAASAGAGAHPGAGSARCLDYGDRTTKLTLIEKLARSPQNLIVGSSRARQAEPSFLRRITGRTGFNAAVTGGTAADGWVMSRFLADRFPRHARGYLWFVDAGIATRGVNPVLAADPRARKYLGADARQQKVVCRPNHLYRPDGSIAHAVRRSPERARIVDESVAKVLASIRRNPPRAGKKNPREYIYFERAIRFANEHGSRPVIVLNPIHPRVLAELEKYGFPKRKAARDYLDGLRQRLDFVVVDCEDIRAWGGSPTGFSDASHIDRANMRRVLRYVVAHADGALG